jgi:predicted metal-dependent hydrolase
MQSRGYDPLYISFLYYFNRERDYFECHEVMEELWLQEGRNPLYQGLLQVAVGLYHHANGNRSGAIKLLTQAVDKLRLYPAHSLGIDLGKVLRESEEYRDGLLDEEAATREAPYPYHDLDIDICDPELARLVQEWSPQPGHE